MYDLDSAEYEKKPPQNLNMLTVINRSHIPQNIAKTVEYTTASTSAWSFGVAIGTGTTVSLLDKDKDFGKDKKPGVTVSVSVNLEIETEVSFNYGQETTEETTDSVEVAMEISWTSKMSVTLVADKFTSNIPFVATMKKYYFDGTTAVSKTEGIFKGVHVSNVHVQYGENKQLDEEDDSGKADTEEEIEEEKTICHDPR